MSKARAWITTPIEPEDKQSFLRLAKHLNALSRYERITVASCMRDLVLLAIEHGTTDLVPRRKRR